MDVKKKAMTQECHSINFLNFLLVPRKHLLYLCDKNMSNFLKNYKKGLKFDIGFLSYVS